MPAALIAQNGRCPEGLWNHVHHRGSPLPHPALAAYLAGEEYAFSQPEVTSATLLAA